MLCRCDEIGVRPGVCDHDIGLEQRAPSDRWALFMIGLMLMLYHLLRSPKQGDQL